MYGTQANFFEIKKGQQFENDVNMYGTQAEYKGCSSTLMFENDVNMYGTQAILSRLTTYDRLRMM